MIVNEKQSIPLFFRVIVDFKKMPVKDKKLCYLVLEDGTILPGATFGAEIETDGEVGK